MTSPGSALARLLSDCPASYRLDCRQSCLGRRRWSSRAGATVTACSLRRSAHNQRQALRRSRCGKPDQSRDSCRTLPHCACRTFRCSATSAYCRKAYWRDTCSSRCDRPRRTSSLSCCKVRPTSRHSQVGPLRSSAGHTHHQRHRLRKRGRRRTVHLARHSGRHECQARRRPKRGKDQRARRIARRQCTAGWHSCMDSLGRQPQCTRRCFECKSRRRKTSLRRCTSRRRRCSRAHPAHMHADRRNICLRRQPTRCHTSRRCASRSLPCQRDTARAHSNPARCTRTDDCTVSMPTRHGTRSPNRPSHKSRAASTSQDWRCKSAVRLHSLLAVDRD